MRRYALAALLAALALPPGHAAARAVRLEPNSYRLAGGGLSVTYLTEGGRARPGPTLSYRDGSRSLLFTGEEVRTEETALGRLVTVTIRFRVDVDATTFSLLVPHVNLGPGGRVTVKTVGITTVHDQPFVVTPPPGQTEHYGVTPLSGTARYVPF